MKTIGGIEGRILRKYIRGRIIDSEDKPYLEDMASVGFIKYGYDIDKRKQTAKTTMGGRSSIL